MAKQLWLTAGSASTHLGNNNTKLNTAASWWTPLALSEARGAGAVTAIATSVAGPTNGIEVVHATSTQPIEWLSSPLSADFTIAGTITVNLWAHESANTVNAAINAVIEKIDGATGVITQIAKTARTTELGTSAAAANFTVAPTSTACKRGDRLRIRVYADDSTSNMAATGTATLTFGGVTASASGDTWVQFTENLTFLSLGASGSRYYLTDSTATVDPGSATEKVASTAHGAATVTAVTNTAAGPTAGIQVTATAGGTAVEWYTPPLEAVTFGGLAELNLRALESNAAANASLKAEIAIVNEDGSAPTVWGVANLQSSATFAELGTTDTAMTAYVAGDDVSITAGQRLRFRIYVDDIATGPLVTGHTVTVSYGRPSGAGAGDTWITLPVVVTDVTSPILEQEAYRFRNDDGTETTATWRQAINTPDVVALDAPFRLRFAIENTGGAFSNEYVVQYRRKPSGGAFGSWTSAITAGAFIASGLSTYYTDNTATTQQISAGTFAAGILRESGTSTDPMSHPAGTWTEAEFLLVANSSGGASSGDTYEFRLVVGEVTGIVLDTYTQTPSLTVGVAGTNWTQPVADTLSLADAASSQAVFARTLADPVALTDATQLGQAKTLADSLALADSIAAERGIAQAIADTLALADLAATAAGKGVTIADTLALADAVATQAALVRGLADTLTLADSPSISAALQRTLTDTLAVADVLSSQAAFVRAVADTLAFSDLATPSLGVGGVAKTQNIADTLALADTVASAQAINRALADTLALTDLVSPELVVSIAWARAIADTLAVTDQAELARALERTIGDTISLADLLTLLHTAPIGGPPLADGHFDFTERGRITQTASGHYAGRGHRGRLTTATGRSLAQTTKGTQP